MGKKTHRFACTSILQKTYMRICVAKSPRKGYEHCLSVYVKKHKKIDRVYGQVVRIQWMPEQTLVFYLQKIPLVASCITMEIRWELGLVFWVLILNFLIPIMHKVVVSIPSFIIQIKNILRRILNCKLKLLL